VLRGTLLVALILASAWSTGAATESETPLPEGVPLTHGPIVPVMDLLAQNVKPGIRPGQWMQYPADCTFSFVVADQSGRLYITSAGHCVDFTGQAVRTRDLGEIGFVRAWRFTDVGQDFALIQIHPHMYEHVDPTMIGWGGPTGLLTTTPPAGTTLRHYGFGSATWMDHSTRCRSAVTTGSSWSTTTYHQHGVVLWGDSGSPTMTAAGLAVGINTHLSLNPAAGQSSGTRFTHALAQLSQMTGLQLTLVPGRAVNDVCDLED
jgi:hypothetical protein